MCEEEVKKQGRLKKQQKRKVAKSSGTLAGQLSRTKTAKGYKIKVKSIKVKD